MRNKRWSKRQSCVSNPENRTFRALARASLGSTSPSSKTNTPPATDKSLTKENLKLHNTMDSRMTDALDATDINTTADNATVYSQFTNETFADVNRLFNSNLASHKEVSWHILRLIFYIELSLSVLKVLAY